MNSHGYLQVLSCVMDFSCIALSLYNTSVHTILQHASSIISFNYMYNWYPLMQCKTKQNKCMNAWISGRKSLSVKCFRTVYTIIDYYYMYYSVILTRLSKCRCVSAAVLTVLIPQPGPWPFTNSSRHESSIPCIQSVNLQFWFGLLTWCEFLPGIPLALPLK